MNHAEILARIEKAIECLGRQQDAISRAYVQALKDILRRYKDIQPATVVLVGESGAGKSSLVNAILDREVLPTNNLQACTSTAIEVLDQKRTDALLEIQWLSSEAWNVDRKRLEGEVIAAGNPSDEAPEDADDTSKAILENLLGQSIEGRSSVEIAGMPLRPGLKDKLGQVETVPCQDIKDLTARLNKFSEEYGFAWPLVRTVKLTADFGAINAGVRVVDLPGLNDPNSERGELYRKHANAARYILLVSRMTRLVTRAVMEFLCEDRFVEELLIKGKSDCLIFVGTALDDFRRRNEAKRYHLPEDAPFEQVAGARAKEAGGVLQGLLREAADRIARRAKLGPDQVEAFANSPAFFVSSTGYLDRADPDRRGAFQTENGTGIPVLRNRLKSLVYPESEQVDDACREIRIVLDQALVSVRRLGLSGTLTDSQANALRGCISKEKERIEKTYGGFSENLDKADKDLQESLENAVAQARQSLSNLPDHWGAMHWKTLQAIVNRSGGPFRGTRGLFDFNQQVLQKVMEPLLAGWEGYFTYSFVNSVGGYLKQSQEGFAGLCGVVMTNLPANVEAETKNKILKLFETKQRLLSELLGQARGEINQRVNQCRRELPDQLIGVVRGRMAEGYRHAAQEHGRGLLDRMQAHLRRCLDNNGDAILSEVKSQIAAQLSALRSDVCSQIQKPVVDSLADILKDVEQFSGPQVPQGGQISSAAEGEILELMKMFAPKPQP